MFMKVFGIGAPAALGAMYMTGSLGGGGGVTYDKPVPEVYSALSAMQMPAELKDSLNKTPGAELRIDRIPDKQVRWRFTQNGHEMLRLTADIEPLSGGKAASVTTTVTFAEGGTGGEAGKFVNSLTAYRGVAQAMLSEQIDSSIEGRPFSQRNAGLRGAAYAATHASEVQADMARLDAMMRDAKAKRSSGPDEPSFRPGQPMVDVSR